MDYEEGHVRRWMQGVRFVEGGTKEWYGSAEGLEVDVDSACGVDFWASGAEDEEAESSQPCCSASTNAMICDPLPIRDTPTREWCRSATEVISVR